MKKVLITGATGYVGQILVRHYHAEGWQVIATARDGTKLEKLSKKFKGITVRALDVTQPGLADISFSAQEPDVIIHAAALPRRAGTDADFNDVNITGIVNVANAAVHLAARKTVHLCFISSGAVFDQNLANVDLSSKRDLTNPFAASKNEAERQLLEITKYNDNLNVSIIYPPVILDKTQVKGIIPASIAKAIDGEILVNNAAPEACINFITSRDIAEVIYAITVYRNTDLGQYPITASRLKITELLNKIGIAQQGEFTTVGMPRADESAILSLMPEGFIWQGIDDTIKDISFNLVLEKLAPLNQDERAEVLYRGNNRSLVKSYGSNTTFYSGNLYQGNSWEEKLEGITLSLIKRISKGRPDGIGAFGGRTDKEDHAGLIDPLDITKVTFAREFREEGAENLGLDISCFRIDTSKLIHVNLPAKDDNYLLARWNGDLEKPATAVDPYCYLYKLDEKLSSLPKLCDTDLQGEVGGLLEISLFEALKRWGKNDLTYDYRYPHEYFACWKLASDLVGHKAHKLAELALDLQSAIYASGMTHKIDFNDLAARMRVSIDDMATALEIKAVELVNLQQIINKLQPEESLTK